MRIGELIDQFTAADCAKCRVNAGCASMRHDFAVGRAPQRITGKTNCGPPLAHAAHMIACVRLRPVGRDVMVPFNYIQNCSAEPRSQLIETIDLAAGD